MKNLEEKKVEFAQFMERYVQWMKEDHRRFLWQMGTKFLRYTVFFGIIFYLCKLWKVYAMRFL